MGRAKQKGGRAKHEAGSEFIFQKVIHVFVYPTHDVQKSNQTPPHCHHEVNCIILDVYVTDHLFLLKDNVVSVRAGLVSKHKSRETTSCTLL